MPEDKVSGEPSTTDAAQDESTGSPGLSEHQSKLLLRMIRVAYPHPSFPDAPYERTAKAVQGASLTDALQRTGVDLGLEELEQVATTAALSAAEGAPVARTLAAKCATVRTALATEQESEARLRTSRLTTPIVGMALIFMALVIYPALSFS